MECINNIFHEWYLNSQAICVHLKQEFKRYQRGLTISSDISFIVSDVIPSILGPGFVFSLFIVFIISILFVSFMSLQLALTFWYKSDVGGFNILFTSLGPTFVKKSLKASVISPFSSVFVPSINFISLMSTCLWFESVILFNDFHKYL